VTALAAGALARRRRLLAPVGGGLAGLLVAVLVGFVLAMLGGHLGCPGGAGGSGQEAPTRSARAEIPPPRLRLYQAAGRRFDLDWAFLASIGAQECNHGGCAGVNSSGCAGPMQIGVGGACRDSWDQYKVDGGGDGRTDVDDPADAIFTAARLLRQAKGAPPAGGSYAAYRRAACGYYGACADPAANYADEVMARAVQYGFHGQGSPAPSNPAAARPAPASSPACAATASAGSGRLGRVRKAYHPRHLAPLPTDITSGPQRCDARIVPDVVYLARRYRVTVTACYGIHSLTGEHPLGAAIDAVPADGDWGRTLRLARDLGWRESCAASGTAPACARPPFRFIGYNGFPDHGDPQHCVPCAGGPHLHLSWLTSASLGEPQNAARTSYFAPSWIEVFVPPPASDGAAASRV
jgi:hypothetical protein